MTPYWRALSFNASGDLVNCGSATSLDNLAEGTVVQWLRPGTVAPVANSQFFWAKDDGSNMKLLGQTSPGNVQMFFNGSVALNVTATNANVGLAVAQWSILISTWKLSGANGDQKLAHGTLTSPPKFVTTYSSQVVGNTHSSDASASFTWGNRATGSRNIQSTGRMFWGGVYDRQLSLQELIEVWSYFVHPHRTVRQPHLIPGCRMSMFLGAQATSTQLDLSSYVNHGTVTGAALSEGFVVRERRPRRIVGKAPAAAATNVPEIQHQYRMRRVA